VLKAVTATVVWVYLFAASVTMAADKDNLRKTQKGLHFTVPDDWPIEKRGGVLAPVPVEEYVLKHFKAIYAEIESLNKSIEDQTAEDGNSLDDFKRSVAREFDKITESIHYLKSDMHDKQDASVDTYGSAELEDIQVKIETLERGIAQRLELIEGQLKSIEEGKEDFRSLQFNLEVLDEKLKFLSEEFDQHKRQR